MRDLASIAIVVLAMSAAPASAGDERPLVPDAERVAAGRAIYQRYCAACHGTNGEGAPGWRRRDANGELPPPPHDMQGHTWRHSDAMLAHMILKGGRDPFNKTRRLTMPAFADTLAPRDVRAVIAFLKTLWTEEQRRFQQEENQRPPRMPGPG